MIFGMDIGVDVQKCLVRLARSAQEYRTRIKETTRPMPHCPLSIGIVQVG